MPRTDSTWPCNGADGIIFAADLLKNGARKGRFSIVGKPARTFRDDRHAEEKQDCGNSGETKHPAPALLAEPGIPDEFIGGTGRQPANKVPVNVLGLKWGLLGRSGGDHKLTEAKRHFHPGATGDGQRTDVKSKSGSLWFEQCRADIS